MRFDVDMNSEYAELFLDVRGYIIKQIEKNNHKAIEKFSQNITSLYCNEYKTGFCYIRTKDNYVHIGWFQGINLNDSSNILFGNGKIIRGQIVKKLDKTHKEAIKSFVKQTFLLLLEKQEREMLRKQLKAKK